MSLRWGQRTHVMGVINVTPDSFSDGGRFDRPERALAQARRLVAQGVEILDLGAQSTRPGADDVGAAEELARLLPALRLIRAAIDGGGDRHDTGPTAGTAEHRLPDAARVR